MAYNREAHELLEATFKVLQAKTDYAYPRMVGYLMPNVSLADAKRIAEIVLEWEGDKR
jgi:hypothetical protein